jgi:hypothetical protein
MEKNYFMEKVENQSITLRLKDSWTVWYHKQDDDNWDISSYIKIFEFSDLVSFFKFKNSFIYLPKFLNGFYFIMKSNIMPIWEDSNNHSGGCFSIRVSKDIVDYLFWDIFTHMICGSLLNNNNETINGISVVPKKYNAIIKIWNNNNKINSTYLFQKNYREISTNDISYRSHSENVDYGKNF